MGRWWQWMGWGVLALGLSAGCSPSHNWRQVRPEGAPLVALMPCKPERAEREVSLLGPGQPVVRLQMMSCEVQGRTYAVAALALPPGLAADVAAQAWLRATWASLKQVPAPGSTVPAGWAAHWPPPPGGGDSPPAFPADVPGATVLGSPVPARWPGLVQHWHGPGVDHRGRLLRADVAWWAAPGWMAQAAVYAAQPDAETVQTMFESVRLSP